MHSAFQSWQLAPSSPQPQLKSIDQAGKPGKRKQNHCCPKSPLGSQATSASQSTPLRVFTCAQRLALRETSMVWSNVSTIHHLRCAKHYLATAVTLNQSISYLKKTKYIFHLQKIRASSWYNCQGRSVSGPVPATLTVSSLGQMQTKKVQKHNRTDEIWISIVRFSLFNLVIKVTFNFLVLLLKHNMQLYVVGTIKKCTFENSTMMAD